MLYVRYVVRNVICYSILKRIIRVACVSLLPQTISIPAHNRLPLSSYYDITLVSLARM